MFDFFTSLYNWLGLSVGLVFRAAVLFAVVIFICRAWPLVADVWNAILGKMPRLSKRKVKVD